MELHMALLFTYMPFVCDIKWGYFGILNVHSTPWFSYK